MSARVPHLYTAPTASTFSTATFFGLGSGTSSNNGTEATTSVKFASGGVISNFMILVATNTCSATTPCRIRANAASKNPSITIPITTTGTFTDLVNTYTVVANDLMAYLVTPGTGNIGLTALGCLFQATTNTRTRIANYNGSFVSTGEFAHLSGVSQGVTTEANVKCLFRTAGTIKNAGINVSANTRNGTTTWKLRINGVDGNTVIPVTTSTTGWIEDLVNTDAIAVGQTVNWAITQAGTTGLTTQRFIAVDFETLTSSSQLISSQFTASITNNITRYAFLSGTNTALQTTEANCAVLALDKIEFSNLNCLITANTVNGTSTVILRKNSGSTPTEALSIGASTTGTFTDTTHKDNFKETDTFNIQITTGGNTGALTMQEAGIVTGSVGGPTNKGGGKGKKGDLGGPSLFGPALFIQLKAVNEYGAS